MKGSYGNRKQMFFVLDITAAYQCRKQRLPFEKCFVHPLYNLCRLQTCGHSQRTGNWRGKHEISRSTTTEPLKISNLNFRNFCRSFSVIWARYPPNHCCQLILNFWQRSFRIIPIKFVVKSSFKILSCWKIPAFIQTWREVRRLKCQILIKLHRQNCEVCLVQELVKRKLFFKEDWTKIMHVMTTNLYSDFSCAKREIKRSNKKI